MSGVGQPFPISVSELNQDGDQGWGPVERDVLSSLIETVESAVTVDALDINGNLDMQSHGLVNASFVQMVINGDAGLLREQFVDSNGDLWYRDGQNRTVQVTSGGTLAIGASTGGFAGDYISTNPNGATYDNSTGKFSFTAPSPSGQSAIINGGPIQLRQGSDTDFIGLNVPASLPATYNLTFPSALPAGQQSIVVCDITGGLNYRLSASFTEYLDVSKGISSSGSPTYSDTGWTIFTGAVDVGIPFIVGDRIDSVSWGQPESTGPITGALMHRSDTGTTAIIARCAFNGLSSGLHTLAAGTHTMTGTLPFTPPGTGSLFIRVSTPSGGAVGFSSLKITGLRKIIS